MNCRLQKLVELEKKYCQVLEVTRIDKVDRSRGNNASGYCGLGRLSPTSFQKTRPNRNVNHEHQDTIRPIINQQNFDGLWDMNAKSIQQLMGMSLTDFPQWLDRQVLMTAIIVVAFETRFASLWSM